MTMDGNGGDCSPPNKPPDGLLAQAAVQGIEMQAEVTAAPAAAAAEAPRSTASIDPRYVEPVSVETYRTEIAKMFPPDAPGAPNDCGVPLDGLRIQALMFALCMRVQGLEAALKPFATKALIMANAQMCLASKGRDEPSGGTWVHAISHSQLNGDERIFFDACDVFGRGRAEAIMLETFERVQKVNAAQAEQEKHLEDGGTIH